MRSSVWLVMLAAAAALVSTAGCSRQASPPIRRQQPSASGTATQDVALTTADGWALHAAFSPAPGSTHAAVLLHQRNGSGQDWATLVPELTRAGISALAVDQRGAGRSTGRANGEDAPWDTTPDIAAAVAWLREKGYAATDIGLVGASYGANNALIYAAAHPDVPAVVLLSPGADYHGLRVGPAALAYKGTALVLYSQDDPITEGGPAMVAQDRAPGPRQSRAYPGSAHGTDILQADAGSAEAIAAFLKARL